MIKSPHWDTTLKKQIQYQLFVLPLSQKLYVFSPTDMLHSQSHSNRQTHRCFFFMNSTCPTQFQSCPSSPFTSEKSKNLWNTLTLTSCTNYGQNLLRVKDSFLQYGHSQGMQWCKLQSFFSSWIYRDDLKVEQEAFPDELAVFLLSLLTGK